MKTVMYFLDYQLSYTIVLASSRSMEPVELAESYPVTEVFMEGATNQLDQEVLDDDLVFTYRKWGNRPC